MGTKRPDENETNVLGKIARNAKATYISLKNDNTEGIEPPHESINVDGITCRNNDIVYGQEICSKKQCYKEKKKTGIIEVKYVNHFLSRQYRHKDLKISYKFISTTRIKRPEQLLYQPNDLNKDNYRSSSLEQHSFNNEHNKEFKKAGKDFTIKTGDMIINQLLLRLTRFYHQNRGHDYKSIALKVDKIKLDYFVCNVSIEPHLKFELFKHIKGSERLQVIRLQEGTLNEDNIFVLKLNDINAHLELIYLLDKMTIYDFYVKFDAVIKPPNPSDGDIVMYTIPKDEENQGFDGCKGLIHYASKDFYKRCMQNFIGKHDLIQIHTTNNSDENTVAEGTLALSMMTAESIRNHNTVLINFVIIKLNE
ncbi:hypothetical protein ACJMK2_005154 [Sinanodonta woodiana]|uniref:Uncharacterized protein n=1 Tax=Sinanodonta woodiana TaxID=1069815 RepID=A0ABD3VPI6_SINWO